MLISLISKYNNAQRIKIFTLTLQSDNIDSWLNKVKLSCKSHSFQLTKSISLVVEVFDPYDGSNQT